MSDASQGPGWWQASDGKWYPPADPPAARAAPMAGPSVGQGKRTSLSPAHAAAMAAQLLSAHGAVITAQTPLSITGYVRTKKTPSMIVAIILFLLCIIPLIIYLISESKDVQDPFTLTFVADGSGTRMHGNGQGRGLDAVAWVSDQIGVSNPPA